MNRPSHTIMALFLLGCGFFLAACVGCGASSSDSMASTLNASAQDAKTSPQAEKIPRLPSSGEGLAAMRQASEARKYLFAFFWKQDDDQTRKMRKVVRRGHREGQGPCRMRLS